MQGGITDTPYEDRIKELELKGADALKQSEAQIRLLEDDMKSLKADLEQKDEQIKSLNSLQQQSSSLLDDMKKSFSEAQQASQGLETEVSKLQSKEAELHTKIASLQEELAACQQTDEQSRAKEEMDLELQQLKAQIPVLHAKIGELQRQRDEAVKSSTDLGQDITSLKGQVEDYRQQSADLKSQIQAVRSSNADLEVQLRQELQASEDKVMLLTMDLEKAQEAMQHSLRADNPGPAGLGSPGSSGKGGDDGGSEADSGMELSERSRGTSVKEIQQQHLFELNSQLQDLERHNSRVSSQLRDALAAKDQLQRRVTELESTTKKPEAWSDDFVKQEPHQIGPAQHNEMTLLKSEVAKSARDTTR